MSIETLTERDKRIPQEYLVQTMIDYCKTLHTKGKLDQLRRVDNFLRELDQNVTPETFGEWNDKAVVIINSLYDEDMAVSETKLHPVIESQWSKTRVDDDVMLQSREVSVNNQDDQEACIKDSPHHHTD
jgi:predicted nuclease with RNAse H fold